MTSTANGSITSVEFISLLLGLGLTLMIFSFFLEDNWLGRFASAIFTGTISAYVLIIIVEYVFHPLITRSLENSKDISVWALIGAGVVSAIVLFYRLFTSSAQNGHMTLLALLSVSIAVMILGAAGGTLPAMLGSIITAFELNVNEFSKTERINTLKSLTVIITAFLAMLMGRHHNFHFRAISDKTKASQGIDRLTKTLVGFSLGAIAAGCFITGANIFTHNIERILSLIRDLLG